MRHKMPIKFKTFVAMFIAAYAGYSLVLFSQNSNLYYLKSDEHIAQENNYVMNKAIASTTDNTSIMYFLKKLNHGTLKVRSDFPPLPLHPSSGARPPLKVKKHRNRRKRRPKSPNKSFVKMPHNQSKLKSRNHTDHPQIPSKSTESHSRKLKIKTNSAQNPNANVSIISHEEEKEIFLKPNSTANYTIEPNNTQISTFIRKYHLFPPPMLPPAHKENRLKPLLGHNPTLKSLLQLFKHKRNGIFIEVGAKDGEGLSNSNTLTLEREYGWRGILIEPDAQAFAALQTKKRKAWLANVCLSTTLWPEKIKFLKPKKMSRWDRISKARDPRNKKWKTYQHQTEEVERKCFPFYSIISALNVTTIDYLSLDVDGAEFEILKTIPFNSVLIRTISLVFNTNNLYNLSTPSTSKEFAKFLEDHGFILITGVKESAVGHFIYAHRSVLKPEGLYSIFQKFLFWRLN